MAPTKHNKLGAAARYGSAWRPRGIFEERDQLIPPQPAMTTTLLVASAPWICSWSRDVHPIKLSLPVTPSSVVAIPNRICAYVRPP